MIANVLVVQRDPLIAQDIEDIVTGFAPHAVVHRVRDVAQALPLLDHLQQWAWAILDVRSDELGNAQFRAAMKARALRPIFLSGITPVDPEPDWIMLPSPFTNSSMLQALQQAHAQD